MFEVGDSVIYKRDVCIIKEIRKDIINEMDYYVLSPIDDKSLTINVPIKNSLNLIRNAISNKEVENLIKKIPNIKTLDIYSKTLDNEYRELFYSGSLEDLITIIKTTTYLRNNARISQNKKPSEKDNSLFIKAEKLLYNELSVSLGKTFDETKQYVIDRINN